MACRPMCTSPPPTVTPAAWTTEIPGAVARPVALGCILAGIIAPILRPMPLPQPVLEIIGGWFLACLTASAGKWLGAGVLREGVYLFPESAENRQALERLADYMAKGAGTMHVVQTTASSPARRRCASATACRRAWRWRRSRSPVTSSSATSS